MMMQISGEWSFDAISMTTEVSLRAFRLLQTEHIVLNILIGSMTLTLLKSYLISDIISVLTEDI